MIFKFTPNSSFESPKEHLYLESQFGRINDVRGAFIKKD